MYIPAKNLSKKTAIIYIFLLGFITIALHYRSLNGGWRFDDPFHLEFIYQYTPWQYFTQFDIMRMQSWAHITPYNALFYDLTYPIGGDKPFFYYIHLLILVWLCACFTWYFLHNKIHIHAAFLAATLCVIMPATTALAQVLTVAHYFYGLAFSLLALIFWEQAIQKNQLRWAMASAFFYAQACLSKELYAPLIGVLFFWPLADSFRENFKHPRLKLFIPLCMVAGGYILLRWKVVGGLGGYDSTASISATLSEPFTSWIQFFKNILWGVFGEQRYGRLFKIIFVSSILIYTALKIKLIIQHKTKPNANVFFLNSILAIGLLLPLLTAFKKQSFFNEDIRYIFLVSWVATAALVYLSYKILSHFKAPKIIFSAFMLVCFYLAFQVRDLPAQPLIPAIKLLETNNHFAFKAPADGVIMSFTPFIRPLTNFMHPIVHLRQLRGEKTPVVADDEAETIKYYQAGKTIYIPDINTQTIQPLPFENYWQRIQPVIHGYKKGHHQPIAFNLDLKHLTPYKNGAMKITWQFTPPENIARNGYVLLTIRNNLHLNGSLSGLYFSGFGATAFRPHQDIWQLNARYVAPDGTILQTPWFSFDTRPPHATLQWQGEAVCPTELCQLDVSKMPH